MSSRLVDPVHFFNARGFSIMTEDDYIERIKVLEEQLATANSNCRTLAQRLKVIADSRAKSMG